MTTLHVLMDNTAQTPGLAKEHGLSMALELPEGLWLWDVGASGAFAENARNMGLDLSQTKGLALSHGHWDHSGGLPALRQLGCMAPVYLHPKCLAKRYSIHPRKPRREIGWRGGQQEQQLHFVNEQAWLTPHLQLHTDIPRQEGRYQAVRDFFLDSSGTRPDPTPDDAALLVQGQLGPALVLGCCHSGLANTFEALRQRTGLKKVHTVVGGLHLHDAPCEAVEESIAVLQEFKVQRVFAGHCTGEGALGELKRGLSCAVQGMGSGLRVAL